MKFLEMFSKDKRIKLFVALGLLGMIIIGISSFFSKNEEQPIVTTTAEVTAEDYRVMMEKQISDLVTSIEGVGKAKVMVTMKSGVEYVYAKEEKQNTDTTKGATGGNQTTQQRDNYEQKTILVEDQNGRKTALIRTTLEPTIRGVVVVCEGGNNILVQQKVIDAVKVALGIGSNKVCVSALEETYMEIPSE